MLYLGDFARAAAVRCPFHTTDAQGSLDAPTANGTVKVIRLSDSTAITAGITASFNIDSTNGLHKVVIDTTEETDFPAGEDYAVVWNSATVDSVTGVGGTLGVFSVENRFPYITMTEPLGSISSWRFIEKLAWLIMRFFNSHSSDNFNGIRVRKDDGSLSTTQAVTESAGVKTVSKVT